MNRFIFCLIGAVMSHMHMSFPPAEGSERNSGGSIERNYEINSPASSKRYHNPCGYQAQGRSVANVTAGQSLDVKIGGNAPHGGGHCQFGFSYDRKTFAITHTVTGTCPLDRSYKVPIDKDAPNGLVTFIWGWNNKVGNREMYINCAEITISGGSDSGAFKGKELLISNISGAPNSNNFPEDGFFKEKGDIAFSKQKPISVSPTGNGSNDIYESETPKSENQIPESKKEEMKFTEEEDSNSYSEDKPEVIEDKTEEKSKLSDNNPDIDPINETPIENEDDIESNDSKRSIKEYTKKRIIPNNEDALKKYGSNFFLKDLINKKDTKENENPDLKKSPDSKDLKFNSQVDTKNPYPNNPFLKKINPGGSPHKKRSGFSMKWNPETKNNEITYY